MENADKYYLSPTESQQHIQQHFLKLLPKHMPIASMMAEMHTKMGSNAKPSAT